MAKLPERQTVHQRSTDVRKVLVGALILLFGAALMTGPAKSAYRYYQRRGGAVTWEGAAYHFPAPWYRREWTDESRIILHRDQLPFMMDRGIPEPGAPHTFAMITFLPADSDFAQKPGAEARFEQSHRHLWSNSPYKQVAVSFTDETNSMERFRCAKKLISWHDEIQYADVDCISLRSGWRFDFEGLAKDQDEALLILKSASLTK